MHKSYEVKGGEGMKKLICVKDIEALQKEGKKTLCIDCNTIVTPAAKDAAKAGGIEISTESHACTGGVSDFSKSCNGELNSDMIYNLLKNMVDKGLLLGIFDGSEKPYVAECDSSGLKVVRGNSVKYEALDTGNPGDKVFYQEIINADDGCSMNAGFITIEDCNFPWECACEELYHVVEGILKVTVNGKIYIASQGDSVFFPKGAKVEFGASGKMKAFYATY